jgi:predicted transposase
MKRTIAIKLTLSEGESQALFELQEKFSSACNQAAEIALREKERNRVRLHHLCYYALRKTFPELGAQMCCNAIAKTTQALKAFRGCPIINFRVI